VSDIEYQRQALACFREAAQARRQASAAERDAARRLAARLVSPRG
jgi:hypothetical protein